MDRLFFVLGIDVNNNYKLHEIISMCNAKAEMQSIKNIKLFEIHQCVVFNLFGENSHKELNELKDSLAYSSNQWRTQNENIMYSKLFGFKEYSRAKKKLMKRNADQLQKMIGFADG